MSTSENWTVYEISSVDYFDQTILLSTQRLSTLTDTQAFNAASGIATALGVSLGSEITINKLNMTQVEYTTNYSNGTFS